EQGRRAASVRRPGVGLGDGRPRADVRAHVRRRRDLQVLLRGPRVGRDDRDDHRPVAGGLRGRRTVKVDPMPSRLVTPMVPPCCPTIWRALASPRPVPWARSTTLPARWNRSKRCSRSDAGMPTPWSVTVATAQDGTASASDATSTRTSPPLGLYLMA